MRRKSALGFVALSLFATGMGVATAVPATASPEDTAAPVRVDASRWTTQGRWVTDAQHRVVITQGINEVAKSAPYAPDAVGFGEDDAAFLEAQGFTSVRLGVLWAGVEPRPGVYDDAYLARVERTVRILNAHGIASVLDFHQDMVNEKYQGEGWPAWAALDHGMPNIVKTGFPGNYFLNEAVKYSFDSFYDNAKASDGIGVADHYASAWRHVAEHFRNVPGVQGYDLFNEPFPGHRYTRCLTQLGCRAADARLSAVQQKTVDAIRSVDKATTVWYEPMQFFNIGVGTNVRLTGSNLGLSFHDYCTSQATLHSYVGCTAPDNRVFTNAEKHSRQTGSGLMLTEFGAITTPAVITSQMDLAARNRVGVQWWAYTAGDPTTAGPGTEQALVDDPARPPQGTNVESAKLALIAV
ncbi:glycoside hydrolase family 5 protein, partial [Cutibacterium acnes]